MSNRVILQAAQRSRWLQFSNPVRIVEAWRTGEVGQKLAQVEAAVNEDGLFAVGFISYEAAPAFDNTHEGQATVEFTAAVVWPIRTSGRIRGAKLGIWLQPRAMAPGRSD